jgi:hypothetical protein
MHTYVAGPLLVAAGSPLWCGGVLDAQARNCCGHGSGRLQVATTVQSTSGMWSYWE